MKIIKKKLFGISEVFISSHDEGINNPPSKPFYILFSFAPDSETLTLMKKAGLVNLGTASITASKVNITVTGSRKVSRVIEYILSGANGTYLEEDNKELFQKLKELKQQCDAYYQKKPKQQAKKKKLLSNYTNTLRPSEPQDPRMPKSAHESKRVIKKNKPDKEYILKLHQSGRRISEIEAFNGTCYQVLLGNRHPKMRPVYNEEGERVGVLSSAMKNFESFRQKIYKRSGVDTPIAPRYLLKTEVVKVLVAGYAEEENDEHSGNFGIGQTGFGEKIDADQTTWPLTAKYLGFDRLSQYKNLLTRPVNAFPVTERDILAFPDLEDARPTTWTYASESKLLDFSKIKHTKKFKNDKYGMFLKRILIPNEAYEAIGEAMIADAGTRKTLVDRKCMRTHKLTQVLLRCREFQDYLSENPNAIEQIKRELAEYNLNYKKDSDAYLRIDLAKIEANYNAIKSEGARLSLLNPPEKQASKVENGFVAFVKKHPVLFGFLVGLGLALLATAILLTLVFTGVLPFAAVGLTTLILGGVVSNFLVAGMGALIGKVSAKVARVTSSNPEKNDIESSVELNKVEKKINKAPLNETEQYKAREKAYPTNFKYSAGAHLLFPPNAELNQEIEEMKDIIFLLVDNLDFFKGSLEDKDGFQLWLQQNEVAATLYNNLMTVLTSSAGENTESILLAQFRNALVSGLQNGDGNEMRSLLCNNPALRKVLYKFIEQQEVIAAWYKETAVRTPQSRLHT